MSDKKLILEKKLEKVHYGFTDSVAGLPVKDLEANLLTYAKHREEVKSSMDESKEIKSAKEALAELQGPYKDTMNAINLKSAYIAYLIKEKNGEIPSDSDSAEDEISDEEN